MNVPERFARDFRKKTRPRNVWNNLKNSKLLINNRKSFHGRFWTLHPDARDQDAAANQKPVHAKLAVDVWRVRA